MHLQYKDFKSFCYLFYLFPPLICFFLSPQPRWDVPETHVTTLRLQTWREKPWILIWYKFSFFYLFFFQRLMVIWFWFLSTFIWPTYEGHSRSKFLGQMHPRKDWPIKYWPWTTFLRRSNEGRKKFPFALESRQFFNFKTSISNQFTSSNTNLNPSVSDSFFARYLKT